MNIPNPINLIQAHAICCQTIHMTVPSPLEANTGVEVRIEFQAKLNGQIDLEFWGELPKALMYNLPKTMAQFATGKTTFPGDLNARESHDAFIQKIITAITESDTFRNGMTRMFSLHQAFLDADKFGLFDTDTQEEE